MSAVILSYRKLFLNRYSTLCPDWFGTAIKLRKDSDNGSICATSNVQEVYIDSVSSRRYTGVGIYWRHSMYKVEYKYSLHLRNDDLYVGPKLSTIGLGCVVGMIYSLQNIKIKKPLLLRVTMGVEHDLELPFTCYTDTLRSELSKREEGTVVTRMGLESSTRDKKIVCGLAGIGSRMLTDEFFEDKIDLVNGKTLHMNVMKWVSKRHGI